MRRTQYGVALVGLVLAVASAGCQVDFLSGNNFACEGENIQSTCLAGYLCNFGRCVPAGQYVTPDTWVAPDVVVVPDIPQDVPPPDVPDVPPPDVPDPPLPGDDCASDEECWPTVTNLVCSAEGVCCDTRCDSECRTCRKADSLGVCTFQDEGTACEGEGGDRECNACNGAGQCLADTPKRCGNCQECRVVTGAAAATCERVAAGEDPFGDCGSAACGAACALDGSCDLEAAAPANGTRCDTCQECQSGRCVPRLPETPDEDCGDEACGGVCAAGGQCTTDFAAPATRCGTCHECDAAGHCIPVQPGFKDAACNDENPCGRTGECDDQGACAIWPVGHVCDDQTCVGTTKTVWQCDTEQTCVATDSSCNEYTCETASGECRTRCHSSAPCAPGYYCSAGACTPKLAQGTACVEDVQCQTNECVDGVCCDTSCAGLCQVCDGSGGAAVGTCAVPVGRNPLVDARATQDSERDCDGQVDACDGVCAASAEGAGVCDYGVTAEDSCGTCKWCSPAATGDCVNRPSEPRWYDDCLGDDDCGGYCEAGSCVFEKPVGAPCGDGPCQICSSGRECALAAVGADPKGLCPGSPACGGGCTAAGQCGTFAADGTLCGDATTPCRWCQSREEDGQDVSYCVLISRDDTPTTLCGGGDDACRGRCTLSGACGPPVPSGAPCGEVCHRCNGAGLCAFAFPDPATEPATECPGDGECGAHCDPDTGACGAPAAAETICGSGDGCSVCQEITNRGMTCVARVDTPPGVCTRPGGAAQCAGRCGSFGVCEWPGQEQYCGECHRCNGDGFCETAAGEQVSAEDCTPDSPDCRGVCLGGRCGFANSDDDPCGGTACRWCQTGICEFIDNGTDPLGQCNTLDHPICGETCDGAGACAPAPGPSDADGPVACGDECRWCSGGACLPIDGYIDDPFGRCEADQVCSAGACSTCGNGVFEAGEVCDPNDPEHPCDGVCTSADPCTTALAIDCQCVESPVTDDDDGSDGCCPPIEVRGADPDCIRWPTPFAVNPDPAQRYTFAQLPAIDPTSGTLYIGGRDQTTPTPRPRIFALSPEGQILWDVSTASDPAFAAAATTSPVLVEGKLYFGRGQWLAVVDIASRTTTEVVNLGSLIKEPPVVASSGLLVVGTAENGVIRGVNPVDGSFEWTYGTGAGALTGPGTRAGRYVYWGAVEAIHAVDLFIPPTASGAARCFAPTAALTTGGVAPGARIDQVTTGSLYLADQDGTLYGLFPADLSGIGCTPFAQDAATVGGTVDATPITLSDGTVVAGGNDAALNPNPTVGAYAFSPDLSAVRWTEALGSHVRFAPAVGTGPDGELVYVGIRQVAGVRVLAIQPGLGGATQGLVWTHDYTVPGAATAALAGPLALGRDGTLYFRTTDGSLNAIVTGSTSGLSNRGWPKRYGDYGNTGNAP